MLYTPPIRDYKPFYIQIGSAASATDIKATYNVVVREHDFPSELQVKEPYKNDWKDEHGDDEYIPATGLYAAAFTYSLDCVMFARNNSEAAAIADIEAGIAAFKTALLTAGLFKVFDSYTGHGFKEVRLSRFPKPSRGDYEVESKDKVRLMFSVEFKVNDPVTRMKYQGGAIVER